jgi:hypothetical protein
MPTYAINLPILISKMPSLTYKVASLSGKMTSVTDNSATLVHLSTSLNYNIPEFLNNSTTHSHILSSTHSLITFATGK